MRRDRDDGVRPISAMSRAINSTCLFEIVIQGLIWM
jgi:hypothetical protein